MQAGNEGSLQSAVVLYTGPLLEGCYEEWVFPERQSREQACLLALETLAERAEERGDFSETLALLRRAEGMDGLRDTIQRSLMRVLAASGDTPAALMTYREYRLRLRQEMNIEPDAETTRLFQQIRAAGRGGRDKTENSIRKLEPSSLPPPNPEHLPLTPLPHPITTLIGREEAVQELVQQVAIARLLTLVGTGGVGKTRLAIQVASEAAEDVSHGAVFVALASLSDPSLLPSFVASALGVREEGSADAATLLASLAGWLFIREVLLVLDNCEHLVEATAQLCQALLERCPRLHILATSRQRLGLTGEIVWRVPSLPSPAPQQLPLDGESSVATILPYPAVQLFVERAKMVRSGFRLAGREDAEAMAHICQRLDGIPLAIELAAARTGLLTLPQIASRLDDRFQLLTGGSRGALTRHQTLRTLIDWSYELLDAPERLLLRRLSVFSDGWTLEAAEAVCGMPNAYEVLDRLTSLVDKSLALAEERSGSLRYRLLETVREYALEKLCESGEETAARNEHLAYLLKLAQALGPALHGPDVESALERVESEAGNFREALRWAQTASAPSEAHVQLTATLWPYWEKRGLSEGRAHLQTALARSEGAETLERAQILLGEARLVFLLYELDKALIRGQESLTLFRRLGDRRGSAEALLYMGMVVREKADLPRALSLILEGLEDARLCDWTRGSALALLQLGLIYFDTDPERARSFMEEGLILAEAASDLLLTAQALQNLGVLEHLKGDPNRSGSLLERALAIHRRLRVWHEMALTLRWLGSNARRQQDFVQALSYLEEAVAIAREQVYPVHLAMNLYEYGCVLYEQVEYAPARMVFNEALSLFRQQHVEFGIGFCSNQLGSTLFHLGEYGQARTLHQEALTLYHRCGDIEGMTWSLERLAVVEAASGDAQQAVRLLGAGSMARERLGKPLDPWDRRDWEEAVTGVRTALGEAEFVSRWTEGRAMSLEQVTAYALAQA